MPEVLFAAGDLIDYYVSPEKQYTPALTGFPVAELSPFDSDRFNSPALTVKVHELVRWFWRVQVWSVEFSKHDLGTLRFESPLESEIGIMDIAQTLLGDGGGGPIWKQSEGDMNAAAYYFPIRVVIDDSGAYGVQTDIFNNAPEGGFPSYFKLSSAGGTQLTFVNPDDSDDTAIATELEYWPYHK